MKEDIKYDYWWAGMKRGVPGHVKMVAECAGSTRRLYEADKIELMSIEGISENYAEDIINQRKGWDIDAKYEDFLKMGIRFIPHYSDEYPRRLKETSGHPFAIFVLGDIPESNEETVGEICVGGPELALGYYNNEEATAKAFVELGEVGRVYKTGDLGYRKGGLLHFAGRRDFQIKHNGHRIELEEIERAMNSLEGIGQACCLYDAEKYRIVAFYAGDSSESDGLDGVPDRKQIVAGLKEKLPSYMLPNVYKCLEELPLSKNGKIDRNSLREKL